MLLFFTNSLEFNLTFSCQRFTAKQSKKNEHAIYHFQSIRVEKYFPSVPKLLKFCVFGPSVERQENIFLYEPPADKQHLYKYGNQFNAEDAGNWISELLDFQPRPQSLRSLWSPSRDERTGIFHDRERIDWLVIIELVSFFHRMYAFEGT